MRDGQRKKSFLGTLFRSRLGTTGLVLMSVVVVAAVIADLIAPGDPLRSSGDALSPPSWGHLMGTDDLGRDILSQVVFAAPTSLIVMLVAVTIGASVGIFLGAIAGFRGCLVDDALMRLTEVFQSLPRFFFAILVVSLWGSGPGRIAIVLGVISWTRTARVVRAEILSLRTRGFVEAARALGINERRILLRHVLPHALPSAVIVIALLGAHVILLEASLSFLGLGDPGSISWGQMIRNGQQFLRSAWWMTTFPSAALVTTVLGINLIADSLNDYLDPLREQRTLGRVEPIQPRPSPNGSDQPEHVLAERGA